MAARSIVTLEDQRVTFVELFFDLVFVFSVTQVVGLVHHRFDWGGVGQGVLVFWLVWWAWTQFTWALNPADTTHPLVATGWPSPFPTLTLLHKSPAGCRWPRWRVSRSPWLRVWARG